MSVELLKDLGGGARALHAPLKIRMDFMRDCARLIYAGKERADADTHPVDPELKVLLYKVMEWGVFNRSQLAELSGVHRTSLSRVLKGVPRQSGVLRGTLTQPALLLLIQALRQEYSGDIVDYGVIVTEMINNGTSPNVARALCGMTRPQLTRALEEERNASDGVRTAVRPYDQGYSVESEEELRDYLADLAGDGHREGPAVSELADLGELPRAPERDTDAEPSAAEDEGERALDPLLDPSTLEGEELREALEAGRAWYPEIEDPIDESGDSYLQGPRIAPPDDFLADFEPLEQADE